MKATLVLVALQTPQSDTHSINVHAPVGRGKSPVCGDIPRAR
jgi:hypothetical protein